MFKRGESKNSKQISSFFSHSPIFLRSSAEPKPAVEYCQCASLPQNLDLDIEKDYQLQGKGSPVPVSHSPSASISSEPPFERVEKIDHRSE